MVGNMHETHGKFAKLSFHYFDKIKNAYKIALEKVLNYFRPMIIVVMVAVLVLSGILYKSIPSELAPLEDIGGIFTYIIAPTSAGLSYTEKYTKYVTDAFDKVQEKK